MPVLRCRGILRDHREHLPAPMIVTQPRWVLRLPVADREYLCHSDPDKAWSRYVSAIEAALVVSF